MKIKVPRKLVCIALAGIVGASAYAAYANNKNKSNNNNLPSIYDLLPKQEQTIDTLYTANNYTSANSYNTSAEQVFNELQVSYSVIATTNVKIRKGPGTDFDQIGLLKKGQSLTYKNTCENGWVEVLYNNNTAYICGDYLNIVESLNVPTHSVSNNVITNSINDNLTLVNCVVATTNLNIRDNNSTDGNKIGLLRKGESLPIIGKTDNGWYQVEYGKGYAYLSGKYVNESMQYAPKGSLKDIVYAKRDTYLMDIQTGLVVGYVPKHEIAEVFGQDNNYYFVRSCGLFGFISKNDTKSLGDNYVIIDISDQKIDVYVDDKIVVTSAIVTGKDSTPSDLGLFTLKGKKKGVTLKGDNYSAYVSYWMPYNGGEGMHDASWRSKFGGEIYRKKGSHGCINLPKDIAPIVYNNVSKGTPVLVKR